MTDSDRILPPVPDRTASATRADAGSLSAAGLPALAGYDVLGKLGEGGMGTVWLAEQKSPRRRVALKVIRGGRLVDEARVRMFRREVETLARLKHPGIAAIHESGRTEDGQPFFSMELVEGVTLDEHLRHRAGPPGVDEVRYRLSLFRRIADAVHYAHQRGVIHRDLKPSNIVVLEGPANGSGTVAGDPDVKILDFGLARLTDPDVQATALSEIGTVRGTLPYMSPEQARGDPEAVDVRTDVYSLGVVLYEMLSGNRPYDVGNGALLEAIRVISEMRPAPLRTDTPRRRAIDPDVETICLKALEKDPDRRYASAAALGDDVERYLARQPILARPPSTLYQLRKLVARNRTPAALVATLFLVAVGSAVAMGVLWQGQREERERAVAEAARTKRLNTFLQGMLESVSPEEARGEEVTVRYLLDQAKGRAAEELGDDPELHAEIERTLGRTYRALAVFDEADTLLHRSLDARRQVFGDRSVEVSATLQDLAQLAWDRGDLPGAEALYREALETDRALGEETRVPTALNNLGALLSEAGRLDEAEPVLREALERKRALFDGDDLEIAQGLHNLATLLEHRGDLAAAESLTREALEMTIGSLGEDHPEVSIARSNLAVIQMQLGRFDEAETLLRDVVETERRVYGERHPNVGQALNNLAAVQFRAGRKEEAVATCREALEIREEGLGVDHPLVAQSLANLARALQEAGRPEEARPLFERALRILRANDALGTRNGLVAMAGFGSHLVTLGESEYADRILTEACAAAPDLAADPVTGGRLLTARGQARVALSRFAEAEEDLLEARRLLEGALGGADEKTRASGIALAELYEAWGRPEDAAASRAQEDLR